MFPSDMFGCGSGDIGSPQPRRHENQKKIKKTAGRWRSVGDKRRVIKDRRAIKDGPLIFFTQKFLGDFLQNKKITDQKIIEKIYRNPKEVLRLLFSSGDIMVPGLPPIGKHRVSGCHGYQRKS